MKVTLPKGYRPPEGAKPGEPFEVVAVLVTEEDGSFSVKTLDGVQLSGEDEEDESEEAEMDPFEFVKKDDNPNFLGE